ncbi:MAG: hypothetical protein E6I88_13490 [Chloroflexi bacterium]|nr:MAG: hypothetical protein E6I88_13490 [Chloroflexota bacterium]TME46267.1 MAG: hypothetical protein E6I56_07575 [Chloroflexota bacterium]
MLLAGSTHVRKGRHNLQQPIAEHGCLTQHSQLDRLRELAEGTAREYVRDLQPTELLTPTLFVIDQVGKESTWNLDRLPLAHSSSTAVQLVLHPEIALDNLVPTQTIMRILRDTEASAAALVAPASASMAALQLADLDHEQSLIARIERPAESQATLAKWDFGKIAWAVRLRQVLRAAQSAADDARKDDTPSRPVSAAPGVRPAEPTPSRRNHRREMREQLHRTPAPAPSWLQ